MHAADPKLGDEEVDESFDENLAAFEREMPPDSDFETVADESYGG